MENLDVVLASFIRSKLEQFKKNKNSTPMSLEEEEWDNRLSIMIHGFSLIENPNGKRLEKQDYSEINLGLEYFAEHFLDLWY